jgi:hypothetical protein
MIRPMVCPSCGSREQGISRDLPKRNHFGRSEKAADRGHQHHLRAHLAEFGIVAPVGRNGVEELLYAVADQRDERIPEVARTCLEALGALLGKLKAQILFIVENKLVGQLLERYR